MARKNSSYLIYLKKEIEKAAEEGGVDFDTAADIIDNFFETLRMYLEDPRLPYIRLGQLGHFQTTLGAIRKYVGKTLLAYRTYPRLSLRLLTFEKVAQVSKVRNRIILARKKKKDGIIWKWVKKDKFRVDEIRRIFGKDFDKYYTENGKRKFQLDREKKS